MNLYVKSTKSGTVVQLASIEPTANGKYTFYTRSSHAGKKWESNVNMPTFNTIDEAHNWMESQEKWKCVLEDWEIRSRSS